MVDNSTIDTFTTSELTGETQSQSFSTTIDSAQKTVSEVVTQVINTPIETVAPVLTNGTAKNSLYQSPNIKFDENPELYLKARIASLVYWEYPRRSASYLGVSLGVLVLTQYYSLLQLLAGFFTLATGANWVYVNTHKQTQRIISGKSAEDIRNPHTERLQSKGALISRDRVTYAAQLTVDVSEVIAQQLTKLILIEDNTQSAVAVGISYFLWTLAKYISTKYLVGFFLVSAFTFPRLYLQHKDIIDSHVAQHGENARVLARQYSGVASTKAQQLYDQAWTAIKQQTKAKKAE